MSFLPKWVSEFKFSDMWTGVKADVVNATHHIGEGVKSTLKGVRGILTPTLIWLAVIAIVALVLYKKFKEA